VHVSHNSLAAPQLECAHLPSRSIPVFAGAGVGLQLLTPWPTVTAGLLTAAQAGETVMDREAQQVHGYACTRGV
jgi:hypothetical protein